jgi:hypothetical protein
MENSPLPGGRTDFDLGREEKPLEEMRLKTFATLLFSLEHAAVVHLDRAVLLASGIMREAPPVGPPRRGVETDPLLLVHFEELVSFSWPSSFRSVPPCPLRESDLPSAADGQAHSAAREPGSHHPQLHPPRYVAHLGTAYDDQIDLGTGWCGLGGSSAR